VPEKLRGPCIEILDVKDKSRAIGLFDLTYPTAPTEWTAYKERIVTIPERTETICIRVRRFGSMERPSDWANPVKTYVAGGTVWIDCMWLVPAE